MKELASPARMLLFAVMALGGCAWDLYTKHWAFRSLGPPGSGRRWIVRDVFALTTNLNEGALFGMWQGYNAVFAVLSAVAVAGILYWLMRGGARSLASCVALGLVTAGALGNLYDRLGLHGLKEVAVAGSRRILLPGNAFGGMETKAVYAVRDFLDFSLINWPIFNFADCFLVTGVGLLLLQSFQRPAPAVALQRAPAEAAARP